MQGIGPWVESSPHWKQSKFIQVLLPYAPWATELSKEAANGALQHIKSEGAQKPSDSSSEPASKAKSSDASTNNPFY
ncbi:MAG TPA: colicin V synthesis protein, partial [Acinetobacter sp.]|nr:colicin V synthesis protein [Acinetobacter sp.]